MITTTLDLNETWFFGGTFLTLARVKESLIGFYKQYEFTRETVVFTRNAIREGRIDAAFYLTNDEDCGCIVGQAYLSKGYNPYKEGTDFGSILKEPYHYLFEDFINSIIPGMTPETNERLAQLDAILALVEEEL